MWARAEAASRMSRDSLPGAGSKCPRLDASIAVTDDAARLRSTSSTVSGFSREIYSFRPAGRPDG